MSSYFTLVFPGDITKFDGNVFKTDTPFGRPVASAIGDKLQDIFDDADLPDIEDVCGVLAPPADDAAVERVARAICLSMHGNTDELWGSFVAEARAALAALRAGK